MKNRILESLNYAGTTQKTVKTQGGKRTQTINLPALFFPYRDIDGQPTAYKKTRFNIPKESLQSYSLPKYLNELGQKSRFYYNGIYEFQPELIQTLYITEGEKKAISLCQNNVFCIANSGINAIAQAVKNDKGFTIAHEVKPEFLQVCNKWQFQNCALILDNDFNKSGTNAKRKVNFTSAISTHKEICILENKTPYLVILNDNEFFAKAFDDFFEVCNPEQKDACLSALHTLQSNELVSVYNLGNYSTNEIEYLTSLKNITEITLNEKYLLNDTNVCTSIASAINRYDLLQIVAPAGVGKSTFILEMALQNTLDKFVIVFPTNSILESLAKEIKDRATSENIQIVNGFNTTEERENLTYYLDDSRIILTTYASFHKVYKGCSNAVILFDEAHKIVFDNTISTDFWQAYKEVKQANKLVLITASPINEFASLENYQTLNIVVNRPKQTLNICHTASPKKDVFSHINTLLSNSQQNVVHQVYYQDKTILEQIASEFKDRANIEFWISGIQDTDHYKRFIESRHIQTTSDRPTLMLCTSFIYEGVSFLNSDIASISVFNENLACNTYQAFCRFRNQDQHTSLYYFTNLNTEKGSLPFKLYSKKYFQISELYKEVNAHHTEVCTANIGSRTDIFNSDFTIMNEKLVSKYIRATSPLPYLATKYEIIYSVVADTPYQPSPPPELVNDVSPKELAKELILSQPEMAKQIVYNTTKDKELKKALKCIYTPAPAPAKEVCKELEQYFSAKNTVESLKLVVSNPEVFLENVSPTKLKKVVASVELHNLKDQPKALLCAKDKEKMREIDEMYSYFISNWYGKTFKKSEIIEITHQHIKSLNGTYVCTPAYIKFVLSSFFEFKEVVMREGKKLEKRFEFVGIRHNYLSEFGVCKI